MDERTYCLTPEQWRHAKACLTLAKRWGLIGDDSPEALERRRAAKNAQAERAEQDGKPVYGTRRFSAPAYLQYERPASSWISRSRAKRSVHWVSARISPMHRPAPGMTRILICSRGTPATASPMRK